MRLGVGEGGHLDAGGGGEWSKPPRRRGGPKVCRIFYLQRFVFTRGRDSKLVIQ